MKPIYDQYYYPPHQPYQQQQHPGYNTATPFMRRAFHDAIYEEEYGSESEEECCRGRGFSAVLCWFLSVIILIGLAASVVLTVFFILKSRSFLAKNNGDLDVLYEGDQGNGLVYPPSTDLNFDLPPTGNKRAREDDDDEGDEDEEEQPITTSTKAPPGRYNNRRNPNSHERHVNPAKTPSLFNIFLDGMQKYENGDFPLTPSKESFVNFPKPASEEIISNESVERRLTTKKHSSFEPTIDTEEDHISYPITTTEKPPPVQQVLFTIPPSTITTSLPSRRNIQTTRFSYGRTSSTISPISSAEKPTKGSKEAKEETNISTNARYNPYGTHFGRHTDEEEDDDAVAIQRSTAATTKSPEPENSDEAQLKKMLLEEIPPHKDSETRNSNNIYQRRSSKERTSFTSSTTTERPEEEQEEEEEEEEEDEPVDTLARIIKNLAPKWGREKSAEITTIPPPTVTSPSASRYNVTMTSRDRTRSRESSENNSASGNSRENANSSRQRFGRPAVTTTKKNPYNTPDKFSTTTVTPDKIAVQSVEPNLFGGFGEKLGVRRNSHEHPIEIMKSPDLSKKYGSKETENNHQRYGSKEKSQHETEGEFIDVLVGADNHKTLVTKQTPDGIVTSAILPPWYDGNEKNDNISDVMKMNGTSVSHPAVKAMNDSHSEEASTSASKEGENGSYPRSEFDLLLNLFSQSPLPKKGQNITSISKKTPPQNVKLQATIVTIKPKTMQADESIPNKRNQAVRKTPNFKDLMKDLLPGLTSTGPVARIRSTTAKPQVSQANNAFHVGSKDGTTDIYGYYPDEETEPDKYVESHHIESEKLSDPDEILDDDEDPIEESPSHVIDVSYHPSTRPEIIIEPDDDGPYDSNGSDGDQYSLGSHVHQTIVPAPADEIAGGGIRRPLSSEEEMEFGESDPQMSIVNSTSSTTSEAPNVNQTESPEVEEKSEEPDTQNYDPTPETKTQNELIDEEESEEPTNREENRRDEDERRTPVVVPETRRPTQERTTQGINKQFTRQRPEESRISEEIKPAPTRYDPRQNIIRKRNKPQPKIEERRRHPSIESVEDFKKPTVNFFEAADPPPPQPSEPAQASPEVEQTPGEGLTGSSYEDYETDEEIPPENETETETGTISEEQKEQTVETDIESNEVANGTGTNNEDPDTQNSEGTLATGTEESVKEQLSDEEQYDKSAYQAELSAERHIVAATEASTSDNRVHRVYSVSYDPSTTETPNDSKQQDVSTTTQAPYTVEEKKKTFIPPKPENFHENKYMFSQQIPETNVFQSKDGWRPVVYDRNRNTPNNQNRNQNSPPLTAQPTPPPPPTYYSTAPLFSSLTGVPSSIIPSPGTVTPTPVQVSEDYEEEEEEDTYDEAQANQQENQPDQEQWSNNNIAANSNQQSKLTIKPSQPIPSPPTPQIKFPENGPEESPKPSTPQPQQSINHPQSDSIDRSKYLVRPAPPPIVMRRTPHSNMPFLAPRPNRPHPTTLAGNKPPQQFVHSQMPPPSQQLHKHGRIEYPHPPHPMNTNPPGRPGPGRFKHLNAGRPRGNIQWPTEDDRRKLFSPNRRLG